MNARFQAAFVGALLLGLSAVSTAQTPPAGNIDERVRQQLRLPGESGRPETPMTGDADLLLLRPTQLFNAHGSLDVNTTSNSYLAPSQGVADQFLQAQAGVGGATRVAGKIDVFMDLSAIAVRYFNEGSLDYNAVSAILGASMAVEQVKVSATYQPSMVFNRVFGDRQLTSHRLRLAVARPFALGTVTVEPEVHLERAITNPSDYKAWTGGVSLTASEPLSQRIPLLAYINAGYDRRVFDDYFEAFVGVKRKDDNLSAGAGVIWRPLAWGEVKASYSYGHNGSTSDVNRYTAHSGSMGVSATLRF
jgi:hypothetical protein